VCPADASLALIDPDITSRRLGLIVAKRLVAASARRNMIRRIVREHFRTTPAAFPAGDWIVRLHESPSVSKSDLRRYRLTGLRGDLQILIGVGANSQENQALTQ
jgi:RNase P protein component